MAGVSFITEITPLLLLSDFKGSSSPRWAEWSSDLLLMPHGSWEGQGGLVPLMPSVGRAWGSARGAVQDWGGPESDPDQQSRGPWAAS